MQTQLIMFLILLMGGLPELTSDNEVPGLEPGLGLLKLSGVVDDGGRVKGPSPLEKGVRWLKVSLGGGP